MADPYSSTPGQTGKKRKEKIDPYIIYNHYQYPTRMQVFPMNKRQFRSDDPERRQWQDPEKILTSLGVVPGMVFIDVGCGDGYFALPAARRVGPRGKVFAVDSDAAAVKRLQEQVAREGLGNLFSEIRKAEETVVCEGCADYVFFGIDLHDFEDPAQVLLNAKKMLRPQGLLIDLDWKDEPMEFGPPHQKRFSTDKARYLIESAGFTIKSVNDAGPYHYLIIASP
jgi:ubiquinone/menaquinone biosynthesis C-methylase UbiE